MGDKFCIAVVTPFLDKRHGTERCIVEQVERLAQGYGYEIHVYSQRIEDIEGVEEFVPDRRQPRPLYGRKGAGEPLSPASGRLLWHRIPDIRGPHLVKYLWWLLANQFRRWLDQRSRGLHYDLVYSPGINCWDADVIVVHIVFHEFYRTVVREELRLLNLPLRFWPRALHRKLFCRLAMMLEKKIYSDERTALAAVSSMTAEEIRRYFGREDVQVILNAIDLDLFSPESRKRRRAEARRRMGFPEKAFVLLIVGNDWKKKGLLCLLEAVAHLRDLPLEVVAVGSDDHAPYEAVLQRLGLDGHVWFLDPSADVLQFYAAADAYVGPSLHDAFALPVAEAMACQLPVVVSSQAGVSALIRDGVDGLILHDPRDASELAGKIRVLWQDPDLRRRLAENAAQSARQFSWEHNAEKTRSFLEWVLRRKRERTRGV